MTSQSATVAHMRSLLKSTTTTTPVPATPAGIPTGLQTSHPPISQPKQWPRLLGLGMLWFFYKFLWTNCPFIFRIWCETIHTQPQNPNCTEPPWSDNSSPTPMRCHDSNIHWSHFRFNSCRKDSCHRLCTRYVSFCSFLASSNYYKVSMLLILMKWQVSARNEPRSHITILSLSSANGMWVFLFSAWGP